MGIKGWHGVMAGKTCRHPQKGYSKFIKGIFRGGAEQGLWMGRNLAFPLFISVPLLM